MNEIPIDDFKRLYRIEGGRAVKIADAGSVATSNRVAGGRAAQRTGRSFEQDLDFTHRYWRSIRRADIIKLPVETQPAPRNMLRDPKRSGMARILASRQRADYMGVALVRMPGPVASWLPVPVMMEAKANEERAASLKILRAVGRDGKPESGHGIKEHQLSALVGAFRAMGTVVAVVWRNGGERLLFDAEHLSWAWDQFEKHRADPDKSTRLAATDAKRYKLGHDQAGNEVEDWLPIALATTGRAKWIVTPSSIGLVSAAS